MSTGGASYPVNVVTALWRGLMALECHVCPTVITMIAHGCRNHRLGSKIK